MANYINIIAELDFPELMWGVAVNDAESICDDNIAYKAMLFINNDGEFVPAVIFRNPFEGKRVLHRVIAGVPCNKEEDNWAPSEGVSILWMMNKTVHYTAARLTAWERFHSLTFITSFGWMKGWPAKAAFDAIKQKIIVDTSAYRK